MRWYSHLFLHIGLLTTLPWVRILGQEATPSPSEPQIVLSNPSPGQALQGLVTIQGDLNLSGFLSAEVSFAYEDDPRDNWFLIRELDQIPEDATIAEWDTTTLTDGDYDLHILVLTEVGTVVAVINGLRVRNYSPIETNTPAPATLHSPAPQETLEPTITPTPTETTIPPSPTPLPTNPAQLTSRDVATSALRGAVAVLGFFALLVLYQVIRKSIGRE